MDAVAPKLNLVVAACNSRGIGLNGQLPWRIRGDMQFFKTITSTTKQADKQNAVIMGRKTWDSIPAKFRPLQGRMNIIISRTLRESPEGAVVADTFDKAVEAVSADEVKDKIESIFIIGGSSVYKMALDHPYCHRIFYTRIMEDFKCDTFLPDFDEDKFKKIEHPDVNGEVQTEKDIKFKFEVFEKVDSGISSRSDQLRTFNVMAAMCERRGIGKNGRIPWPFIKKDYEYYIKTTSSVTQAGKKVANIKGRVTWEETGLEEKLHPNRLNIVISKTLRECPEYVHHVVPTLEAALEYVSQPPVSEEVESVWVMGGEQVFKDALFHPQCKRLCLNRIHKVYECDRFFPPFEDSFRKIKSEVETNEEDGTVLTFQVFEKL